MWLPLAFMGWDKWQAMPHAPGGGPALPQPGLHGQHTTAANWALPLQDRQLDGFYSLEEECLANKADCAAVCRQLQQPVGTPADKLRLALVWLLTCESGERWCGDCCRLQTRVLASADARLPAHLRAGGMPWCSGAAEVDSALEAGLAAKSHACSASRGWKHLTRCWCNCRVLFIQRCAAFSPALRVATRLPAVPPEGDCQQVEGLLAAAGADMAAWHYAKRMRRLNLTGKQQVRREVGGVPLSTAVCGVGLQPAAGQSAPLH